MLCLIVVATLQAAPLPAVAHELLVPSPSGHTIAGTLELPPLREAPPVVVLIGGAGPDTRSSGTILTAEGSNGTFVALSSAFRAAGLAVVRFDEVGTGASTGDYGRSATTRALAADVEAIVRALSADARVDGRRIAVVGFSEGAVIAALVAGRTPAVVAVAGLAAPARDGAGIMRYQDSIAVRSVGASDSTQARANLRAVDSTRRATEPWYREFLTLHPLDAWRAVRVPTLLIAGADDRRVPPADAARIASALPNRACVTTYVAPQIGHTLVSNPWDRHPAPIDPAISATLVRWLAQTLSARCVQRNDACC